MTSTVLTDAEITSFIQGAEMFIGMTPSYRQWAPIKQIPEGNKHTWYILEDVPRPTSSIDGRDYKTVQTSRQTNSATIQSFRYSFSIPRVQVDMARQNNVPIWAENVGVALRKMNISIEHLILEGSEIRFGDAAVNGLRDGGTDVGVGPDTMQWSTPPAPINHLQDAWGQLITAGYDPNEPKTWILSSNLAAGLKDKYGAGDPSMEEMVSEYGVDQVIYLAMEASATPTELATAPIGYRTADNGVWFLYPRKTSVWYLAEVFPPRVTLDSKLDEKQNCYYGFIEWRGTVAILQATGIIYFPEVDF